MIPNKNKVNSQEIEIISSQDFDFEIHKKKKYRSKRAGEITANTFIYIVLSIMGIIWLLPIFWIVMQSFRLETGTIAKNFFPKGYTFENYNQLLFKPDSQVKFLKWFGNTFFVAFFTSIISTLLVLLTSYAFSRLRFKARQPMMKIILILGMFPGFMSMVAIYHVLKVLGLIGSSGAPLFALILVYTGGSAMGYYISKGYFDTIPKSIDEAAMIDGASKAQIFWQITLPMSKPIVIYTALTSFLGPWGDYIFARMIIGPNGYDQFTVAPGLFWMLTRENIAVYWRQFTAASVIIGIPITILFMIMQKYYVSGVTGGSVKG